MAHHYIYYLSLFRLPKQRKYALQNIGKCLSSDSIPQVEMCGGENLLERERKETGYHLKKIFLFPIFFSFFEWVFSLFLIFLGVSNSVFCHSFPVLSSFHLSKPIPSFFMGLNLAILERVLNENLSKPVLCRSTSHSSPFQKSLLIFLQPVFLSN